MEFSPPCYVTNAKRWKLIKIPYECIVFLDINQRCSVCQVIMQASAKACFGSVAVRCMNQGSSTACLIVFINKPRPLLQLLMFPFRLKRNYFEQYSSTRPFVDVFLNLNTTVAALDQKESVSQLITCDIAMEISCTSYDLAIMIIAVVLDYVQGKISPYIACNVFAHWQDASYMYIHSESHGNSE